EGFFTYAVADAIATRVAYREIRKQAEQLLADFRGASTDILPDAAEKFGLLTEVIQVQKAIALATIQRNGLGVDLEWVRRGEHDLRRRLDEAVVEVRTRCPGLYKTQADGSLTLTKNGAPSKNLDVLRRKLHEVVETLEAEEAG